MFHNVTRHVVANEEGVLVDPFHGSGPQGTILCEITGERYLLAYEHGPNGRDIWTRGARREKDWCTKTHATTPLPEALQKEIGRYVSEAMDYLHVRHTLDIDI